MSDNFYTPYADDVTLFMAEHMNPPLEELDVALSRGVRINSITALTDADATLTAAQILGGLFTITPTAGRALTVPTAANIIAALSGYPTGTSIEFTVVNLAAFNSTITTNTSITLVGNMVVNNASATFRCIVTSGTTVSIFRM